MSEALKGLLKRGLVVSNIIEAIADGVLVIDKNGDINLVNPALCRMLGLEAREIMGKGWGELFIENSDNLEFSQVVIEVIQTGRINQNSEVSYHSPDGAQKEFIATASLLREENGDILGVVAVFKDITELAGLHRRERKLLKKSRALYEENKEGLDRIARAVAHEVRNPVMAIGGLATRLLKETKPSSKTAEYLKRILDSSARLERVVEEVRLYSEIPAPHITVIRLDKWLNDFLEPYRRAAKDQGIAMETALNDELTVELDHTLFTLALGYILENAIEAMHQGGLLKVGLEREGEWAVIEVVDTGRGIESEELPYLFDPFYTTKADSAGMSLAISKRVLAEHHGKIEVRSTPGVGSVFRIILPIL